MDQPEFRLRLKQLGFPAQLFDPFWSRDREREESLKAVLEWRDGKIQLRSMDASLGLPIEVDFLHGKTGFRFQRAQHEMVVKAVAGRSKERFLVLDATAGLGRDSFILAAAGYDVISCERHPAIACLLMDGLDRALDAALGREVAERIKVIPRSAHEWMSELASQMDEAYRPEVIYLDPMFPERSKPALVKKEMRVFRDVVGDDMDAESLLTLALQIAKKRVVVKRPRKAETLAGAKPGYQIQGKSSRMDVYPV